MREAGLNGGLMAEVAGEVQHADVRVGGQLVEDLRALVMRPIVNKDDFAAGSDSFEHIKEALMQFAKYGRFVAHWGNY